MRIRIHDKGKPWHGQWADVGSRINPPTTWKVPDYRKVPTDFWRESISPADTVPIITLILWRIQVVRKSGRRVVVLRYTNEGAFAEQD